LPPDTAIPAEKWIKQIEIEIGDSRNKESLKKIQLWTNQDQTQYAITLEGNSELLATTDQNTKYTELVKQSNYLEELEYDWDYTLNHWINNVTDSHPSVSSVSGTIEKKLRAEK